MNPAKGTERQRGSGDSFTFYLKSLLGCIQPPFQEDETDEGIRFELLAILNKCPVTTDVLTVETRTLFQIIIWLSRAK